MSSFDLVVSKTPLISTENLSCSWTTLEALCQAYLDDNRFPLFSYLAASLRFAVAARCVVTHHPTWLIWTPFAIKAAQKYKTKLFINATRLSLLRLTHFANHIFVYFNLSLERHRWVHSQAFYIARLAGFSPSFLCRYSPEFSGPKARLDPCRCVGAALLFNASLLLNHNAKTEKWEIN